MLLRTRFYLPPLRANCVVRTRLLQKLQQSSGGSLCLVAAPAGYGKTTLVSQWLHYQPQRFAWLSLGPEHDVLDVFWQYAIQSLQQIQPDLGREAQDIWLRSPRRNYASVVISLLNDLDALAEHNQSDDPIALVLDDFHFIENPELLGLINLFLDHLPSSLRLVITSRNQPELKLSRRRANGQLLQLGTDDLRFDDAEALDFFHYSMHLPQADKTLAQLRHKTEGWVAGMQLVALSLKGNQVTAEELLPEDLLHKPQLDRHISDYLLEEVFQKQSRQRQLFLMLSALSPKFCAGLCNAVGECSDSMQVITELESSDLFLIPMDNHRTWYRYHDLFRQFLLFMAQQWPQVEQTAYCERALSWLQENGYYVDAMELCVQHALWDQARALLNDEWLQMEEGAAGNKAYWLSRMPVTGGHDSDRGTASTIEVQEDSSEVVEPLTRREQAVLELISQGLSNKAIAEALFISPNTLKVHIRNLYGKMGVENRTQALLKLQSSP
ncbi:MAG: LuxR family transcriptional regulator [Ketobacter sp.]|nr:MAG: LuxR family transcriptional regulator [Ketobacter sp.]